jgi:hypothetical protein
MRLTVGFTCRRDKQDTTAYQPPNLRKSPPHPHAEGGQVQTVLAAHEKQYFLSLVRIRTLDNAG